MPLRKIIFIDEEKCDGCGACITGCAEGALRVIDGKARLVSDSYCDGLGACLGDCPRDALKIVEREAVDFDEEAALAHMARQEKDETKAPEDLPTLACGCPGSLVQTLEPISAPRPGIFEDQPEPKQASSLGNWPIQLHLVPPRAPFLQEAELLLAADCTGFSLTALHRDLLPGKALLIACPKLDNVESYKIKLAEIFKKNRIKGVTVLYMTVPCCAGLIHLVKQALEASGQAIPLRFVKIDPGGEVVEECLQAA